MGVLDLVRPKMNFISQSDKLDTSSLSATKGAENRKKTSALDSVILDRLLRKPRSKKFIEAIVKLDAGGHTHNHNEINDLLEIIKAEFSEVDISGILLGFVSKCYLGKPYEVHSIDYLGRIIEHYKNGTSLPDGMEKARGLAIFGGYEFIEVYTDCCRAINSDGSVSVIKM